jgi:hypothetical protein
MKKMFESEKNPYIYDPSDNSSLSPYEQGRSSVPEFSRDVADFQLKASGVTYDGMLAMRGLPAGITPAGMATPGMIR